MTQEIQTLVRLKNINLRIYGTKHVSAFDLLDRMTDEEIEEVLEAIGQTLVQEGRLD